MNAAYRTLTKMIATVYDHLKVKYNEEFKKFPLQIYIDNKIKTIKQIPDNHQN